MEIQKKWIKRSGKQITLFGIPVLGIREKKEFVEETMMSSTSEEESNGKNRLRSWLLRTVSGGALLGFITGFTTNWVFAKFQAISAHIKTATFKVTAGKHMADIGSDIYTAITFLLP